jgi:NAD(P)-dependent dehydrogenase (short-subunit alcohol dehydrogenase family)
MDLTNASAIVTGGAGGFGSATARRLVQMGAKALTVRATRSPTSENSVMTKFSLPHHPGITPVLRA